MEVKNGNPSWSLDSLVDCGSRSLWSNCVDQSCWTFHCILWMFLNFGAILGLFFCRKCTKYETGSISDAYLQWNTQPTWLTCFFSSLLHYWTWNNVNNGECFIVLSKLDSLLGLGPLYPYKSLIIIVFLELPFIPQCLLQPTRVSQWGWSVGLAYKAPLCPCRWSCQRLSCSCLTICGMMVTPVILSSGLILLAVVKIWE